MTKPDPDSEPLGQPGIPILVYSSRRELTEPELSEIRRQARQEAKNPATLIWLLVNIAFASFLFLAAVKEEISLAIAVIGASLGLFVAAVLGMWLLDSYRFQQDARSGCVDIEWYREPPENAPVTVYETLPRSQRGWTENGRPRRWRREWASKQRLPKG